MRSSKDLVRRAKQIRFLLLDVDGVLTDGLIYLDGNGKEIKAFHIHDGHGLHLLQEAGIQVGLISGRTSHVVDFRAKELGITEVHQGVSKKLPVYLDLLKKYKLQDPQIAYMGDDIIDIPILERAGLAIAVANAVKAVKLKVHMVTMHSGGEGAVREVSDFLLSVQNKGENG
jgi:3-deoxy-D-manno-octulosonate 8-phosphate phosphatase (KDO 8-P phosphatase)